MTYLLDINVLIALLDSFHVNHEPAHCWFSSLGKGSWATCPMTENGLIRIVSSPAYATLNVSPSKAVEIFELFREGTSHLFWPDDLSVTDESYFDLARVSGHQQLTDVYLVGLAARHGGKIATFDKRISQEALSEDLRSDSWIEVVPDS